MQSIGLSLPIMTIIHLVIHLIPTKLTTMLWQLAMSIIAQHPHYCQHPHHLSDHLKLVTPTIGLDLVEDFILLHLVRRNFLDVPILSSNVAHSQGQTREYNDCSGQSSQSIHLITLIIIYYFSTNIPILIYCNSSFHLVSSYLIKAFLITSIIVLPFFQLYFDIILKHFCPHFHDNLDNASKMQLFDINLNLNRKFSHNP